jgi:hypothetical protein
VVSRPGANTFVINSYVLPGPSASRIACEYNGTENKMIDKKINIYLIFCILMLFLVIHINYDELDA